MSSAKQAAFSEKELTTKITSYILSEVLLDKSMTELSPQEDLLDDGLVDSLGIMRLIAYIESEFGFSVPAEDVTVESFMSVDAVVAYLQPQLQASP